MHAETGWSTRERGRRRQTERLGLVSRLKGLGSSPPTMGSNPRGSAGSDMIRSARENHLSGGEAWCMVWRREDRTQWEGTTE